MNERGISRKKALVGCYSITNVHCTQKEMGSRHLSHLSANTVRAKSEPPLSHLAMVVLIWDLASASTVALDVKVACCVNVSRSVHACGKMGKRTTKAKRSMRSNIRQRGQRQDTLTAKLTAVWRKTSGPPPYKMETRRNKEDTVGMPFALYEMPHILAS